jgi:hypothetical protein
MTSLRTLALLLLLLCSGFIRRDVPVPPPREEWVSLFNGKDLTGWDIKITGYALNENHKETFRVADGMLQVSYDHYDKFTNEFGHIYYRQPYSHYRLRMEYRFVGEQLAGGPPWDLRNSGVMVHSQSARSLTRDQEFPVSLEMQFLGGLGKGPRTTGNLCTPGTQVHMDGKLNTQHCINSSSATYDGDRWVQAEMEVFGDSLIRHIVEGQTVLTYQKPIVAETGEDVGRYLQGEWEQKIGTPLKEGYIALQAESHPIHFRKIELLNLKGCTNPRCPNYKPQYVVPGDCNCQQDRD